MDINIFKNKPLQKNMLICGDMIFTNANIMGGVNFNQTVNAGTDIVLGSCTSSAIEFQLENLNMLINDIAGKEITWKQGTKVSEASFKDFILTSQSDLVCKNGNIAYVVEKTTLKLTIWDVTTNTKIKDVSIQPTLPIKSLLCVDGVLYCGHDEAPYITKYTVAVNDLVKDVSPILTEFQISKILYYNKYNYAFNMQGNILKEYTIQKYDLIPVDLIESAYEFIQMGIFKAEKPIKTNDTQLRVKCYDRMMKFDVIVDDWLDLITYPTSLKNYLIGLCNYIGVTLVTTTFLNENYTVKKNFNGQNVKGRHVLKWICEIAVKYAIINEQGQLILDWYKEVDYDITNSDYYNIKIEDYLVKKIDKVQVRVEENDIGVIVGTGTNAYVIQNNPLLYAETDTEIRPTVENIYNAIKDFTYYPFEISANNNPLLKAGDIVTIKTRGWEKYIVDNLLMTVDEMTEMVDFYGGKQVFQGVIMTRKMTNSNDVYSATGNIDRSINKSVNQSILQIRGKTNVLERTIDETLNRLYDATTGDITEIKLTSDKIAMAVNASKLTFDETGLTIKNGGFRILGANDEILLSSENGNLELRAYLKTGTENGATYIDNTGIYFVNNTGYGSEIKGGASLSLTADVGISLDAGMNISIEALTSISLNAMTISTSGNFNPSSFKGRSCSWKGWSSLGTFDSVLVGGF